MPPEAPRIPLRGQRTDEARRKRLSWLSEQSGVALDALAETRLDSGLKNIEVLIGAVEVPVGLAGPLLFDGELARGHLVAPLATTEAAIVASCARGATALTRAGGVRTRVLRQRHTRVPAFVFPDEREAQAFAAFVGQRFAELDARVREASADAQLTDVEVQILGPVAHVVFGYARGDASAHLTTACTWTATRWLAEQTGALGLHLLRFMIEGGLSGVKKVTRYSIERGRGLHVVAEAVVPADVLRYVLDVSADDLLAGHAIATAAATFTGMVGFNLNVANLVAAIFVATGQDLGCIAESSVARLSTLPHPEGGVQVSLDLPTLVCDTIGDGTRLPAQGSLLAALGCSRPDGEGRLAEVIAGFALALELSTASAVLSGGFGDTHQRVESSRRAPG